MIRTELYMRRSFVNYDICQRFLDFSLNNRGMICYGRGKRRMGRIFCRILEEILIKGSLISQKWLLMLVAHCTEGMCKIPMDLAIKTDEIRLNSKRFIPLLLVLHSINDKHLVRFLFSSLGYHIHLMHHSCFPIPALSFLIPLGKIDYVLVKGRLGYAFLMHLGADVLHRGHLTIR